MDGLLVMVDKLFFYLSQADIIPVARSIMWVITAIIGAVNPYLFPISQSI
jgi:hypothetical protein